MTTPGTAAPPPADGAPRAIPGIRGALLALAVGVVAAALGLPFAFASHFAPDMLLDAIAIYRRDFRPSEQLDAPYAIAGINAIAADDRADAERQFADVRREDGTLLSASVPTVTTTIPIIGAAADVEHGADA